MDPEGVRQVFYAECGAAADYGVRRALRTLPFRVRSDESQFVGVHLPLTRRLPRRLDVALQQWVALHSYDAIVFADIDPVILDADDLLNLLAYVEGGGGLLLMAGPNSFARAQRNWGPLREALPAAIELHPEKRTTLWNEVVKVEAKPTVPVALAQPHAITRGLSGGLGNVSNIHRLQPHDTATILATAGDQPLIVAGGYGRGHVIMVAAYPGAEAGSMFTTAGWDDLLRQALAWLMNRPDDLCVERCEFERAPLEAGQDRVLRLHLAPEYSGPLTARARVSQADEGWRAAGREPQFGEPQTANATVVGNAVEFAFRPAAPGLWRVQLEMESDKTDGDKAQGGKWANVRLADIEVLSPRRLKLFTRHGRYVIASGSTVPLRLSASEELAAILTIVDFDGREVWCGEVSTGPVDVPLPQLELGDYEAIARCGDEEAHLRFCVTAPLRHLGFSIVATGVGGPTEARIQQTYDYYRDRGFNAFAAGLPPGTEHETPSVGFNAAAYSEYLIQRDGFDLWGEYQRVTLLSTHAHYGDEGSKPTTPCIYDPEHDIKLRELVEAKARAASIVPRMASLEILDEPHVMPANVCRCVRCLENFQARHGYTMPMWDEAINARDHRTRAYFEWAVDYAAEAFRRGYEIWKSLRLNARLHHVLCAIGSGSMSARATIAEDLPWSAHADYLEFDCYNYMYPHWRPVDALRWNEFHYLFGHFRFLARRNRQQLGFFIQVTDRDPPLTPWDPLRAPSETLYSAIGGGAKIFHLMSKGGFSNKQNCREEKFDTFAEDIKKVQRAAPLLERAEAPRSRIATVFPFHDRLYRPPEHYLPEGYIGLGFYGKEQRPYDTVWPNHKAPINVAELLFRAFGEVDVIDGRALHEGALDDYGGFVLTGTDYIADEDAEAIIRFVEQGGVLVCDHVPTHKTNGEASHRLAALFEGQSQHFYRDTSVTYGQYSKGHTLLFSHDLNELYTGSIEQDDQVLRYRIKDTVREFFTLHGLRPHAFSSDYEVEADVLLVPDTVVLVAVNHGEERRRSHVTIYEPPFAVTAVYDLVTMMPRPFSATAQGIEIDLDLDEREGLLLGLYAAVPTQLRIVPDAPEYSGGRNLSFNIELTDDSGQRVRGDHIVEVCVTDAGGTQRRQFSGLRCASNGLLRIDEPLGINARAGEWVITAFDRFTTQQCTSSVQVRS